jgi:hypothetical protein
MSVSKEELIKILQKILKTETNLEVAIIIGGLEK